MNPAVRKQYGTLSGIVGICCNLVLFAAKLGAGLLSSSVAVTADAFNNLSDAGSSIVTFAGFKLAGMPADDEHPFGHGRFEYITGFIVAIVILLMGLELFKTSVEKILHPSPVAFYPISVVIMILSIGIKLWMYRFNRALGEKIKSEAIIAVAKDSRNDAVATLAVVLCLIISSLTEFQADGIAGSVVALFILYTGFQTARDTINPLLGPSPDKDLVEKIKTFVLSYPGILGLHDLIIHTYGPGHTLVSLHVEVSSKSDILVIHDTIDRIERDLKSKFGCEAVIHMDPIVTDDALTKSLRKTVTEIVKEIDESITIHDFRVVPGPTHTNIIFDVVVPHKFYMTNSAVTTAISEKLRQRNPSYEAVITVDQSYC